MKKIFTLWIVMIETIFCLNAQQTYTRVHSLSELSSWDAVIIVGVDPSTNEAYAMGYQKTNNRHAVPVQIIGEHISTSIANNVSNETDPFELIINEDNGIYTFYDALNDGYLYAASSSANYLRTQTTLNANGQWGMTFNEDGTAEVVAQGENTRNIMRFNKVSEIPYFSCFSPNSSIQNPIYFYTRLTIGVATNNATDVTQTHATLNGIIFGDANISSQGFQFKKTTDSEYQTIEVSGSGSISTTLSGLTPNTQYRFRAFCIPQEGDPIYGELMTFNTLTINATTYPASNVTASSATLNGNIDAGDAVVSDKGFKYWPTNNPQNVSTVSVSTTGYISATINNLAQNTYQYRAFAESYGDMYQGGIQEFEITWLNNDTIFVYDADMLHWVAEQCNSGVTFEDKCVKLMNDIELPFNVPNNMISIGSYPNYPFKGTFNGNGKHITNLYIDQPNTPYQGFFGYTLNANLYNVGLVNITASGRNYTGGMVAYAKNTHMRDCYVNGGTLFALSYCGGLVGYQEQGTNSIISGCYNTCSVTGNHYVGGLIGFSNYSTVRNSYVAGPVSGQGNGIGAIIGGANYVLMYYCYFNIDITGQTVAIGENNFKDGEGLTNEQMRDPEFVATLNQGLVTPVWKADYETPINNGFPIIVWQEGGTTGIEEDNAVMDYISLYPNPANDFVTIQSDEPSVSLKQVEVYDVMGRKVMLEVLNGQSHRFSIANLHAGVYHIRVQTSNGCYTHLKLVVQ